MIAGHFRRDCIQLVGSEENDENYRREQENRSPANVNFPITSLYTYKKPLESGFNGSKIKKSRKETQNTGAPKSEVYKTKYIATKSDKSEN
jgi:hypothetical protein